MKKTNLILLFSMFIILVTIINATAKIDVEYGIISFTEDNEAVIFVYEDQSNQVQFIDRLETINVEYVEMQLFHSDINFSSNNVVSLLEYNVVNNTKKDIINTTLLVEYNQGLAVVPLKLTATATNKFITIIYKDLRFTFSHISKESALPVTDIPSSRGEYQFRLFTFGLLTALTVATSMYLGSFINHKAKRIDLPENIMTIVIFSLGILIGLMSTIQLMFTELIINELYYYIAVALASLIVGMRISKVDFMQYIGLLRKYKRGKEIRTIKIVEIYIVNNRKAVVKKGFIQSLKRLLNLHTYFQSESQNYIDYTGYEKGFELESVNDIRIGNENILEWATVDHHKLPSRMVADLTTQLQLLESAYSDREEEITSLKSNKEVEIARRISLALEQHYAKMGVNYVKTNSISDETYKLASKILGKTELELREIVNEQANEITENSSSSKIRNKLKRFRV